MNMFNKFVAEWLAKPLRNWAQKLKKCVDSCLLQSSRLSKRTAHPIGRTSCLTGIISEAASPLWHFIWLVDYSFWSHCAPRAPATVIASTSFYNYLVVMNSWTISLYWRGEISLQNKVPIDLLLISYWSLVVLHCVSQWTDALLCLKLQIKFSSWFAPTWTGPL